MEIHTIVCPPVNAEPAEPAEPAAPSTAQSVSRAPQQRKRVRRWHHRGFTGCSTCRRRHVRCDEASPSCKNCSRLGLDCDGTQGRMTFKVYGPSQSGTEPSAPEKRGKKAAETVTPTEAKKQGDGACDAVVVSPTTVADSTPKFRFEDPFSNADVISSSLDCVDGRYFSHFVDQVSSLLLIYDNSTNVNPFRKHFPDVARSSPLMVNAMQALGALHLANTSVGPQRMSHFQKAMGNYGEVVKSFRAKHQPEHQVQLTDLATCLLLCLFEMMDSQHHNWAVHLKGAREIYRLLFSPNDTDPVREAQRQAEINHPLRNFLVSLLSYLDVAGSCATSDGTVVEGSYWLTQAGGWEYNLGTPSLSPGSKADDPHVTELRQSWSNMMEIQAAISAFGKSKQWMPLEQQDTVHNQLLYRLTMWRNNAPECVKTLGRLDDESLRNYQYPGIVEYAGCVEAYEKATIIFLHKVAAAGRPDWQAQGPRLQIMASRILALIGKLATNVGQLAVLWPLFVAGRETRNESEQNWVRQTMVEIQRFGFNNVEKGREELERIWFARRAFPDGWIETMDDVRSSILLP